MTYGFPPNPERTKAVLAAIVELTAGGLPTTIREIQQRCRISSTSVTIYHVRKLEDDGKIVRDAGIARSIRPAGNWRLNADEKAAIRAALTYIERTENELRRSDLDIPTLRTLHRLAA